MDRGGLPSKHMRSVRTVSPTVVPSMGSGAAAGVEFKIWRSDRILGLEVIDSNSHSHRYPPHMHDALEIIWVRSGSGRLNCQNHCVELCDGEAVLIPPNELHSGGGSGSMLKYVAITLPKSLVDRIVPDFRFMV